jgi:hypothetical protein
MSPQQGISIQSYAFAEFQSALQRRGHGRLGPFLNAGKSEYSVWFVRVYRAKEGGWELRGMVFGESNVFVHVKTSHALPRQVRNRRKGIQHLQL